MKRLRGVELPGRTGLGRADDFVKILAGNQ